MEHRSQFPDCLESLEKMPLFGNSEIQQNVLIWKGELLLLGRVIWSHTNCLGIGEKTLLSDWEMEQSA